MGVSVGRGGRRETYLERGETDQGQHDQRRDVLAVGSAGMLVRRDVWDALGGFADDLPLFRDDIDFCWRAHRAGHRVVVAPDAVVHHAEAAAHGRRAPDAAGGAVHRADRRSALLLLLGNLPAHALPWAYVRLTLGSLARALGLLIGKAPGEAAEEMGAWSAVVARPDRVRVARQRRSAPVTEPWSSVRPLLAPTGTHLRHGFEALVGAAGVGGGGHERRRQRPRVRTRRGGHRLDDVGRRRRRRAPAAQTGVLGALGPARWSRCWPGAGCSSVAALQGGALLPAPGRVQ